MCDPIITEGPILNPKVGWICPKCGLAVSPDQKTCPNCTQKDNNNFESTEEMILS